MGAGEQCYRYNGKELVEDIGLYDYGARWYDPSIARWNAVDPLAEKYSSLSPYVYVKNNPLIYIDPDGRDAILVINKDTRTVTVQANVYWSADSRRAFAENGHPNNFTTNSDQVNSLTNIWEGRNFTTEIDGETYNVAFDVNIIETDSHEEAVEKSRSDGAGNLLLAREKNGSSGYSNGTIYLNLNQKGIQGDGKTFSHELGHAFGLALKAHPKGKKSGVSSIMSYSAPRDATTDDVAGIISNVINIANQSESNSVTVRLSTDGESNRTYEVIER